MSSETKTVTRFAPSPTGRLHLGHAYSALFAAESSGPGGRFHPNFTCTTAPTEFHHDFVTCFQMQASAQFGKLTRIVQVIDGENAVTGLQAVMSRHLLCHRQPASVVAHAAVAVPARAVPVVEAPLLGLRRAIRLVISDDAADVVALGAGVQLGNEV